jgi:class 3 adenylate cyclase/tetratricopeptide (TPR) repeat protein
VEYTPRPVDTSHIQLDARLLALTETLARDTHETWARQRIAEGWTVGPTRDDASRTHPGLVPYEALPESEKAYDRAVALQTVRVLVALGYRLEAPAELARDAAAAAADACRRAEAHLRAGEPLLAYDVVSQALAQSPRDARLRQIQGLALARSGATERAQRVLAALRADGHADEESLGMLARTHKDLWETARRPAERARHLAEAARLYRESWEATGGIWTGINAATLAVLLGEPERGRRIAAEVAARIDPATTADQYWALATLAEAALVAGDWASARQAYAKAAAAGRGRWGDLASTRRNALLLLRHAGRDARWLDAVLPAPRVVVFTGHMIDRPGRRRARFPPEREAAVRQAIAEALAAADAHVGYASAACGGDILFHEALTERGGESHVILPFRAEDFRRESVEIAPGWGERYERVLARAADVVTVSAEPFAAGASYVYANLVLHGLARMHADRLGGALGGLAAWDGRGGDGVGGTGWAVQTWRALGTPVTVVGVGERDTAARAKPRERRPRARPVVRDVVAMLFADAVGFSKLTEPAIPRFVEHYLGLIAAVFRAEGIVPLTKNTWGDGLYVVFADAADAARYALALRDRVAATDWRRRGLPAELNLRIALHAGPVFTCVDPVIRRRNWVGTHVSRAARIEPVTPPGEVYVSQAFAALVSSRPGRRYRFDYVGQLPLAKGYGSFATYHMRGGARPGS